MFIYENSNILIFFYYNRKYKFKDKNKGSIYIHLINIIIQYIKNKEVECKIFFIYYVKNMKEKRITSFDEDNLLYRKNEDSCIREADNEEIHEQLKSDIIWAHNNWW